MKLLCPIRVAIRKGSAFVAHALLLHLLILCPFWEGKVLFWKWEHSKKCERILCCCCHCRSCQKSLNKLVLLLEPFVGVLICQLCSWFACLLWLVTLSAHFMLLEASTNS